MRRMLVAALAAIAILSPAAAGAIDYEVTGPFDASKLPFISEELQNQVAEHMKDPDLAPTYVLAISATGGYLPWAVDWTTKARIRLALHNCEHYFEDRCGLAVVNGKMVKFEFQPQLLTYGGKFDADAVPFVPPRDLPRLEREYANAPVHRAMALTRNGLAVWSTGQRSKHIAKQNALAWCRDAGWGHCFLYDVNGQVVFTPETDIFSDQ